MVSPISATGPTYTFFSGGYGERVIDFLGQMDLVMYTSPNQFDYAPGGQYPTFWGCYYGLVGFYGNYPTWRNFLGANVDCYQYSGFTINGSGVFNVDYLLSNPYTYSGELSGNYALGCFDRPIQPNGTNGEYPFLIMQTRFGVQIQTIPNGDIEYIQKITLPNLTFEPATGSVKTSTEYHTMTSSLPWGNFSVDIGQAPNSFVIEDDFGNYTSCSFSVISWQYGSQLPPSRNTNGMATRVAPWHTLGDNEIYYSQGAFEVCLITKNGGTYAADLLTSDSASFSALQINPQTGVFFGLGNMPYSPQGGVNAIWTGNVLTETDGSAFTTCERYYTTLSITSDNEQILSLNSQLNLDFAIQICPGGDFLCMNNSAGPFFYVKSDLSGYYRLNISFPDGQPTINNFTSFGMDLDGFIYMVDVNQANPTLYSTQKPLGAVLLPLVELSGSAISCRPRACHPWEG